ncbi:MAG: insulinase family protein [Prevotella sp.]|nr:insulinase family protein [Prevotella sp.]
MNYNTATLANGLRVIHLPSPSPVLYCGYQVAAGTRHEQPGEEGLAHFCEHMAFKGTARRTALQIINHLERVGGDLNAFTTKEATTYYAAILSQHAARAVDLLTDIVFSSQYPAEELEREKAVVCDEIESYNDSPAELIFDEFENLLFPGHPLGHNILGTAERVQAFTPADCRRFAARWYQPANAVFFAYGDIDFKWLVGRLANIAAGAPAEPSDPIATIDSIAAIDAIALSSTAPAHHQAHVMIGCRAYAAEDPRRMPLYILNNMLGGPGMNARLNLSLRERNGLVYTVESNLTAYSDTGTWAVYFGCDHHDTRRCLHLVRRELDRLMRQPLSTQQLNAAKRQLKGQIGVATDNREQFALDFSKSYLYYGQERDIQHLFRRIDAVTPEQIHDVARELFVPERLQTLIID